MATERFRHSIEAVNGDLRCITVPIPTARSITLIVLARAGSRYESRKESGISHFMEHMFFKGAEKYPDSMAVASAIDGAGGNFNAFTSEEVVGYYVKISSSRKEVAYDVLSDMLLRSKFDPAEIERERGVIIEEIRMHHDDPMSQVYLDFHSLILGDQPLGWDIAGTEETVNSLTQEDFLSHKSLYYFGANCVVTAAGDITPEDNRRLCEKYFEFSGGADAVTAVPFAKMPTRRAFMNERKTEQAHFVFGFLTEGAEKPDEPAMKILNTIIGGSMSSRLFHQIRERRGLAYYIHSSFSTYNDVGLFQVSAGVNLNKMEDAIKCAVEEIVKLKTSPVTGEELARAKQNLKGNLDLALEDSRRVAHFYGLREILYNKIKTPEMVEDEIDSVTAEQIQNAAKKYFLDNEFRLAVIGPFSKDTDFSEKFRVD